MYVSPIHVKDKCDNAVFRAVQEVGIEVDKDELLKALQYDRGQYEKGYSDGRLYKPPVITNADRIRAMMDEELAEWLIEHVDCTANCCPVFLVCNRSSCGCERLLLDWLKQEATE